MNFNAILDDMRSSNLRFANNVLEELRELRATIFTDTLQDRIWSVVFRIMDLISNGINHSYEWCGRTIAPYVNIKNVTFLTITSIMCYYLATN